MHRGINLGVKRDFLQAFGCSCDLDPAGGHPPSENVAFLIISEGVKPNREIRKTKSKSKGEDVKKIQSIPTCKFRQTEYNYFRNSPPQCQMECLIQGKLQYVLPTVP